MSLTLLSTSVSLFLATYTHLSPVGRSLGNKMQLEGLNFPDPESSNLLFPDRFPYESSCGPKHLQLRGG